MYVVWATLFSCLLAVMSDIPPEPPYNHLKHLSECPTCFGDAARQNQYMTHVFMSQGRNNPETEGCWGQKVCVFTSLAVFETSSLHPLVLE